GGLDGVEAVIDKDHASSLLARKLNADILLISTSVEKAYLHFGTPEERAIDTMTVSEARRYISEGHFKPGSMLPKVEAMIEFVEAGGGQAALTDPANLVPGLAGETGTRIVPDPE
ncbi:MAG: carbamate kinase, partial [Deltaproteobacteria bacterium]|nr:carbamate kinase [Deltaproteobacteria bacterium]